LGLKKKSIIPKMPKTNTPQRKRNKAARAPQVTVVVQKPQTGKPSQSKQKRTRKQRRNNVGVATINSIEKRLGMMAVSKPKGSSPYVMCRLDPFSHSGSNGIPDGANSQFIVIDNLIVNRITATNTGGFVINTQSWLPSMARLTGKSSNTGYTVDGFGLSSTLLYGQDSWYPMSVPTPYLGNPWTPGSSANDPYVSTTARLVSVQYKLTYTGTPLTCQGTYTVTPNSQALTPVGPVTTTYPALGVFSMTVNSASGAIFGIPANTPVMNVDVSYNPSAFNKDSLLCRQERPLVLTPKHSTADFKLGVTTDLAYALVNPPNGSSPTVGTYANYLSGSNGSFANAGVTWYDNDWQNYQISVDGYQSGATFIWETSCCFEYVLTNGSPFVPLSKARSENNPGAIKEANRLVDNLPTGGYDHQPR
jgi:hypothetical protein